jgi:hypothetical protein
MSEMKTAQGALTIANPRPVVGGFIAGTIGR